MTRSGIIDLTVVLNHIRSGGLQTLQRQSKRGAAPLGPAQPFNAPASPHDEMAQARGASPLSRNASRAAFSVPQHETGASQ